MTDKPAVIYRRASTSLAVLVLGIALSVAAAYLADRQLAHEARLTFDADVSDAQDAIATRIRAYADLLVGIRGLFLAENSIGRGEFRRYVQSLDLDRRYPGIQVIHFSRRIPAAQRSAFEARVRADTSIEPRGYPDFTVHPRGERAEYTVVQYVEPTAGTEGALGLDLGGDAVRLAALDRARDSGQLMASGAIALANDPSRHPGFAMRLAVYRRGVPLATPQERREAFTGMVSASFVVIDLMRGALSAPFLKKTHVQIHDAGFIDDAKGLQRASIDNLMFDSNRLGDPAAPRRLPAAGDWATATRSVRELEVGGRRWILYFTARAGASAPFQGQVPWIVLACGVVISLLLSGLIRSLASTGRRAAALAERITQDLRRSEASLAEAQRMTQQLIEAQPTPIFFKGTDGRYLGVNKAWEAYFGVPRETFLGKTVHDLYPNDPDVAARLHAMDEELWAHPGTQTYEAPITTADGERHDAIYYKATFTRGDGRIAGLVGTIVDITERKRAEARALHLAHYDELTGLPNRSMFQERVAHALAQARRDQGSLALLFIDLDHFKKINDTLGHEAGDRALKVIADRLRGCLRESDTVCRLGGDEFVVLIEKMDNPESVAEVAKKILGAVAQPFALDGVEYQLSASIGISTYPADSEDMQGLMKNADISMYRAKEQDRNNYQFYSARMNVHTVERLALESDLRHALARDEFRLHFQPKVDMRTGRITGAEALLRWQPPGAAMVPPARFIPLAEETGLIVPIGEWVLKTACMQSRAWADQGLPPLRVAVNLSARQFTQERLLEDVARTLRETRLDPAWLEFEITESMVMRDPEHAVRLLGGLKAMGIRLSVDDFGTGYSSLNYLKRFPLDSVKIDRSFVQELPGNADDAAITRAVIAMAHSLRLTVIAEGVETAEQLAFLRELGCDEMQGYLFSKPVPEEGIARLLRDAAAREAPELQPA